MKDNISPEEKLLRLIRGKNKQDKVLDKKSTNTVTVTEITPPVKQSIPLSIRKYSFLFDIHKIIRVVFVASCIYLVTSLIYPWVALRKIKLPNITQEKTEESKIELKPEVKPYEFYLEGIGKRQIFSGVLSQETQRSASAVNVDVDLVKDINLVGIISGENPQAVIEDKKTQKVYYLNKGQFIGEFQVEDMQEGKIILNYKGQRFELYL